MEIAPLALVVLLGYGLLIAVALTAWTALAYYREDQEPQAAKPVEKVTRPVTARQVSNDDVRGAKSRRARRPDVLFERTAPVGSGGAPAQPSKSGAAGIAPGPERGVAAREPGTAARGGKSGVATAGKVENRPAHAPEPARSSDVGRGRRESGPTNSRDSGARPKPAGAPDAGRGSDEDAFERFLRERPDDFDIR